MPSGWTSCMSRPSGPSCWRRSNAPRKRWWCSPLCRYVRVQTSAHHLLGLLRKPAVCSLHSGPLALLMNWVGSVPDCVASAACKRLAAVFVFTGPLANDDPAISNPHKCWVTTPQDASLSSHHVNIERASVRGTWETTRSLQPKEVWVAPAGICGGVSVVSTFSVYVQRV